LILQSQKETFCKSLASLWKHNTDLEDTIRLVETTAGSFPKNLPAELFNWRIAIAKKATAPNSHLEEMDKSICTLLPLSPHNQGVTN
jgi:hypothetical protein